MPFLFLFNIFLFFRLPLFHFYLAFYPILTLALPSSNSLPDLVISIHQWRVVDVQWNQRPLKCKSQSLSHSFFFLCVFVCYCPWQSLSLWSLFLFSNIIFTLCSSCFLFSLPFSVSPLSISTASPCFSYSLLLISFVWAFLSLSVGCISSPLWRNKTFWSSTRGEAPSALIHFILVTDAYSMAYYCVPQCFCELYRGIKHKPATVPSTHSHN